MILEIGVIYIIVQRRIGSLSTQNRLSMGGKFNSKGGTLRSQLQIQCSFVLFTTKERGDDRCTDKQMHIAISRNLVQLHRHSSRASLSQGIHCKFFYRPKNAASLLLCYRNSLLFSTLVSGLLDFY